MLEYPYGLVKGVGRVGVMIRSMVKAKFKCGLDLEDVYGS